MNDIEIIEVNDKLCLQHKSKNIKPIFVDFLDPKLIARAFGPQKFSSNIYKAIKIKNKENISILDATAGLGKDSFLMAACGANVCMIEQNDFIFKLLEDGLTRAKNSVNNNHSNQLNQAVRRLELYKGDAIKEIPILCRQKNFDIIYLDPMFTGMKQSPLPKKELLILRELLQETNDTNNHIIEKSNELFNIALNYSYKKVVVKRHKLSNYLNNLKPNHSINGKTNRYDIYLK